MKDLLNMIYKNNILCGYGDNIVSKELAGKARGMKLIPQYSDEKPGCYVITYQRARKAEKEVSVELCLDSPCSSRFYDTVSESKWNIF